MTAALARIVLRYVAMALIAHGYLSTGDGNTLATDPDVQMMVGLLIGALTEGWYWLAKRCGWTT